MSNDHSTPDPAQPAADDPDAAGAGREVNRTWDRLQEEEEGQSGPPNDQVGEGGRRDGGLPHDRDVPGEDFPAPKPDLPPLIGPETDDEGEEAAGDDPWPEYSQPGGTGGRSTPI